MHPFMAAELGTDFDLNDALKNGMIPLVKQAHNKSEKIASYISLYLKEEVQTEGLVRNIGDFARFLEVISFSHGSVINYSAVARECGVSRKIVDNYISILEDLLIGYLLPVFNRKAKRKLISHRKFYYFDSGVYYHLRPKGSLDHPQEINGISLEGLVLQHLRAWSDYSKDPVELSFWRTKSGVEVDFVIYGENYFFAIELKNSNKVNSKDLNGLRSFTQDYPACTLLLLYRGKDQIEIDYIICMPVEQFLLKLTPNNSPI